MTAINKLLDKARETCALNSDAALAARLQVSRAQLSSWRVGREPIPEDRIATLARIAHADPGEWLILIEAEQARGEARKAYGSLVKRLGIAALLAIVSAPVLTSVSHIHAGTAYYVRRFTTLARFLRAAWAASSHRRLSSGPMLALQG